MKSTYGSEQIEKDSVKLDKILDRYEPITETGCWIYTGPVTSNGYGTASLMGRNWLVHRLSLMDYAGSKGDIDKIHRIVGGVVRHKCDVPSCINPDHLIEGSQSDNINDMVNRGRGHWQKQKTM